MLSKFKIKTKLFSLVAFLLFLICAIGGSNLYNLRQSNATLKELFDNQITPLKDLKTTSDKLSWNVLVSARKVDRAELSSDAGAKEIDKAFAEAQAAYARYSSASMTPEEKVIADKTQQDFLVLSASIKKLSENLASNNVVDLKDFLDTKLQPQMAPVIEGLDKLAKIQTDVVATTMEGENKLFKTTLYGLVSGLSITVLIVLLSSWLLIKAITKKLESAAYAANEVANGNLTVTIDTSGSDEISQVMASLNKMIGSLSGLVTQVRSSSDSIATGATQVSAGSADLSQRTEKQAAALQETAATLEQLNTTVKQNADNAQTASQLAVSASQKAKDGGALVSQVVESMSQINEASNKIEEMVVLIDSLTFQTNILALNAAIEAARAGEQGRGFAVVAGEVRALSHRCADAAKEIKTLVLANLDHVEKGSDVVSKAGESVKDIITQVQKMADLVGEISEASKEQANGIEQVTVAVGDLDQTTQQNAALVEESTAAAESLKNQASQLVDIIKVFKLEDASQGNYTTSAQNFKGVPSSKEHAVLSTPKKATPSFVKKQENLIVSPSPAPVSVSKNDQDWETF